MDQRVRAVVEAVRSYSLPHGVTDDCGLLFGHVLKSLSPGADHDGAEYRDLYLSLYGDSAATLEPYLQWESLGNVQLSPTELIFAAEPFGTSYEQIKPFLRAVAPLVDNRRAYVVQLAYLILHERVETRAEVPYALEYATRMSASWAASPVVVESMSSP